MRRDDAAARGVKPVIRFGLVLLLLLMTFMVMASGVTFAAFFWHVLGIVWLGILFVFTTSLAV